MLSGRYGPHVRDIYGYRSESGKRTRYDETPAPTPNLRKKDPLQNVTQSISQGHFSDAAEKLFAVRIDHPRAKLSQQQLRELAEGLVGVEDYEEAESILEEYIERHPDDANWACLRLAAIQLQINGQPRAALQTLKHVHRESLTDSEKQIGRKLSTVAKEQIRAGVQDRQPEW